MDLDVVSIEETFLDISNNGNHNRYPVSYSSCGKHIERASYPLKTMQRVKQDFFFFFFKTVPACLLRIHICFIATIAGNADMASVCKLQILWKRHCLKKGVTRFQDFSWFLISFL